MKSGEEGRLVGDAGKCKSCVPGAGWREEDGKGEDTITVVISDISGVPVWIWGEKGYSQAIISQTGFWRNLALQLPTSEHSHNFLIRIFAQHCLCESEYPWVVNCGSVLDLSLSPEICFAVACQDDGVSTIFIGRDAVSSLVDDAITIGSGRFQPPAVRMSGKGIMATIVGERTYSPTSKPRWPKACARDGSNSPSTDQAEFNSCHHIFRQRKFLEKSPYIIWHESILVGYFLYPLHSPPWTIEISPDFFQWAQLNLPLGNQFFCLHLQIHWPAPIP